MTGKINMHRLVVISYEEFHSSHDWKEYLNANNDAIILLDKPH